MPSPEKCRFEELDYESAKCETGVLCCGLVRGFGSRRLRCTLSEPFRTHSMHPSGIGALSPAGIKVKPVRRCRGINNVPNERAFGGVKSPQVSGFIARPREALGGVNLWDSKSGAAADRGRCGTTTRSVCTLGWAISRPPSTIASSPHRCGLDGRRSFGRATAEASHQSRRRSRTPCNHSRRVTSKSSSKVGMP